MTVGSSKAAAGSQANVKAVESGSITTTLMWTPGPSLRMKDDNASIGGSLSPLTVTVTPAVAGWLRPSVAS